MSKSEYHSLDKVEEKRAIELVKDIQNDRSKASDVQKKTPKILLPYQARWNEDISQVRIGEKPRRVGYTWGAYAAEAALESNLQGHAGMDQFYMGYNQGMAAEFIGDAAFFVKAYQFAVNEFEVYNQVVLIEDEKRDIVTYRMRCSNGNKIEALSSAPHNWRGRQGHARIDEAAFHPQLKEVIKGALAFTMWGGRVSIISTHHGEDNDFNGYVKEIKAGKLDWSLHSLNFDQALKEGFYKRVCLITGKEWSTEAETEFKRKTYAQYPDKADADEELGCIPKRGTGVMFSRMLLEAGGVEDVPVLRFFKDKEFFKDPNRDRITQRWIDEVLMPVINQMHPDCRTAIGQDFARDGDASVMIASQETAKLVWTPQFRLEMRHISFDMQEKICFAINDNVPLFHKAGYDARGNGQSIAEKMEQEYGEGRIICNKATTAFYNEHVPKYHQAIESCNFMLCKDEDTILDHRNFVRVSGGNVSFSDVKSKGSDGFFRHGDSAIASLNCFIAATGEGSAPAGSTHENKSTFEKRRNSGLGQLVNRPAGLKPRGLLGRRRG